MQLHGSLGKSAAVALFALVLLMYGTVQVAYGQGFFDKTCDRCHGTGYIARIRTVSYQAWWIRWDLLRIAITFYNEGPEAVYRNVTYKTEQLGGVADSITVSEYFPVGYITKYHDLFAYIYASARYSWSVDTPNVVCPNCNGRGYVTDYTKVGFTVIGIAVIVVAGTVVATRRKAEAAKITPVVPPQPPPAYMPGPPAPPLIYCRHCGAQIADPSVVYCPSCGKQIR